MAKWDRSSFYFSGQGVWLIAERDSAGKPKGFTAVGNVSAAQIAIAVQTAEHNESQSGQRAVDVRLTTGTTATLSLTLENFAADVLALALRGSVTTKPGASVVAEAIKGYLGKVMPVANAKTSALTLKRGATSLTAYVNDSTAWDYKFNLEGGSIQLNDGSVAPLALITTGGTAPSAITVGATTTVTVANTAAAGDLAVFTGFAGTDAALINGKALKVVSATSSQVVLELNTTGRTITVGTPLSFFDGGALAVDYTYAAQKVIDALTTAAPERYLRFEGLNTLDGNEPVILEVPRYQFDPAQAYALLNAQAGQVAGFQLNGSILQDALITSGSQYFRQISTR
jgi:hypothetical protein